MDRRTALTLAAAAIFALHALHYWPEWIDDAFITFRYAENWWNGGGMVFNPQERVEGITNLGWALVLAPFANGDLLLASKVLGLISGVGSVLLLGRWCREQELPLPAMTAALAAMVLPPWAPSWTMYGLETAAAMALVTAAWVLYPGESGRRGVPWSAVAMGLGPWVRPDAALAVAMIGLWHFVRRGPKLGARVALSMGVVAALGAGLVLLKLYWFGGIMPHTSAVKLQEWPPTRGFAYLATFWRWPSPPFSMLVAGALAWGGLRAIGRDDRVFPALLAAVWTAVVVAENGDFMWNFRFLVPVWPAFAAAVGAFVAALAPAGGRIGWLAAAITVATTQPMWGVRQADGLNQPGTSGEPPGLQRKDAPLLMPWRSSRGLDRFTDFLSFPAAWSVVHRGPTSSVAWVNIGLLGWASDGPIIDLLGLTDPLMVKRHAPPDLAKAWSHIERDVDWLILDLPVGEWARYRALLAAAGWRPSDGCHPYWVFRNPGRSAPAPTDAELADQLDVAFARNPRNTGLLAAIGRELAAAKAPSAIQEGWATRIDSGLTEAERGRYRCDVGLTPGCATHPTCEEGRPRLEVAAYQDPASWPAGVGNTTIVRVKGP